MQHITTVRIREIIRNKREDFFVFVCCTFYASKLLCEEIDSVSKAFYCLSICNFICALISNMAESWQQPRAILA